MKFDQKYLEKVYAGLFGKIIGVRLGAPVEPSVWTYERILESYGEITDYVKSYKNFAADDDINGPMFFIQAVESYIKNDRMTAQDCADTWLNVTSEGHGMFWWGGYGISTEHTAFDNLKKGISAPQSGSVEKNGSTVAQQIGGQIFVDTWGLVFPSDYKKAGEMARISASVSHDASALDGAQFVAGCISHAFNETDILKLVKDVSDVLDKGSEYRDMIEKVLDFYKNNPDDWRKCFLYVKSLYSDKKKYPGVVHVIPNSAVIVLSLLYSKGNFSKGVLVATMCGWDTDCNAGNVGTILGVMNGIQGIEEKWKKPIKDFFITSSVIGSLNIWDIPCAAKYIAALGAKANKEPDEMSGYDGEICCDFEIPGSTHGFRSDNENIVTFINTDEEAYSGNRSLKAVLVTMEKNVTQKFFIKPFYRRSDFSDERYKPQLSPKVYPGQKVSCVLKIKEIPQDVMIKACMYIKYDGNTEYVSTQKYTLRQGEWERMELDIPDINHTAVEEIGFKLSNVSGNQYHGIFYVDDFKVSGKAAYAIDFSKLSDEWGAITQFTWDCGYWSTDGAYVQGICSDHGEMFTGNYFWKDYTLNTKVKLLYGNDFKLLFRVNGNLIHYGFGFEDNMLVLFKKNKTKEILCKKPFAVQIHKPYEFKVWAKANKITVFLDGEQIFETLDSDPILNGHVGYSINCGSRIEILDFSFKEE